MRRTLLIVFTQLLAIISIAAQTNLSINGKVTDNNGNGLPGASVIIKGTSKGVSANKDGYYIIERITAGTYTLKVSFLGYETTFIDINLTADKTVNITLKNSSIAVQEVIVRATRAGVNTPVAFKNIKAEEIKSVNIGQDLPTLLNLTPSMVTTSDAGAGIGYTGIRVRGSDATRVNVTINGVPVNDAESHGVWWVNMPDITSSVQDIQIQRGVGTSTNGAGAFGATVNLQTESLSNNPMAEFNLSGGSFGTHKETVKFSTGLVNEKLEFSGRLSNIKSDGYIDRASSDLKSYYLGANYTSGKTLIKALAFGGKEKTYQAWYGIDKETLEKDRTFNPAGAIYGADGKIKRFYDNQTDNYQQHHSQLHVSHQFTDNITANIGLHYTKGKGYYEEFNQNKKFSKYGLSDVVIGSETIKSTDNVTRKWLDNDLIGSIYSINYKSDKLNMTLGGAYSYYSGDHFGEITWARYAVNIEKDHKYYDNVGKKRDFNTFLKASYQVINGLYLFADLQVRNINYKINGLGKYQQQHNLNESWTFFNPKFGASYKIDNKHSVYASYAIAHREPNRDDFIDAPNGKPKAEKLEDYEAGYRFITDKINLNLNYYFMQYTDQLVLTGQINSVGSPIRENVGKSYRTGIEFIAAIRPYKFIEWQPNISLSNNINSNYILDNGDGTVTQKGDTKIAYSPSVIAGSNLKFIPLKNLSATLLTKHVGKQYMNNYELKESELDAYTVFDVNINYTITKVKPFDSIEFSLLLNNIFDTKYESNGYMWGTSPYYFPQAGFNFLAGVTVKF